MSLARHHHHRHMLFCRLASLTRYCSCPTHFPLIFHISVYRYLSTLISYFLFIFPPPLCTLKLWTVPSSSNSISYPTSFLFIIVSKRILFSFIVFSRYSLYQSFYSFRSSRCPHCKSFTKVHVSHINNTHSTHSTS